MKLLIATILSLVLLIGNINAEEGSYELYM